MSKNKDSEPQERKKPEWVYRDIDPSATTQIAELAHQLDLSPSIATILWNRGFHDAATLEKFLHPKMTDLPSPFLLPEMEEGVTYLVGAIQRREKIVLFGDYDVDGITGTSQLYLFLKDVGANVDALLPNRFHDGYGLTASSMQKILLKTPQLVITIDNGTAAHLELEKLRAQGIPVIIIDHHEKPNPENRPSCLALINPKSTSSQFPDPNIAAAGLAFLFLVALRAKLRDSGRLDLPNMKRYLALATLGTIADVVPLKGINRWMVQFGLPELTNTDRPGLKALKEVSGMTVGAEVTSYDVAFRLAPRINAAGRLEDPRLAFDPLTTSDAGQAQQLALTLNQLNTQRQKLEETALKECYETVDREFINDSILVLGHENWHLGVVGIIAARLTERYHRPAIVMNIHEGKAKGSARSVSKVSVYEVIKQASSDLLRFGGHDAAAGLMLPEEKIASFRQQANEAMTPFRQYLVPAPINIESRVSLEDVCEKLLQNLKSMEPFGAYNPQPTFVLQAAPLSQLRIVGENHLKAFVEEKRKRIEMIGFRMSDYMPIAQQHTHHEIAFFPKKNIWNGEESIQLQIKAIRPKI